VKKSERFPNSSLLAWILMILGIYFPMQFLLHQGFVRTKTTVMDTSSVLLQRALAWDMMRFRRGVSVAAALTDRLNSALQQASGTSSLEHWRQTLTAEFAPLGSGAVDILLTNGIRMIPEYPGYSPATLAAFLQENVARAESLRSPDRAAAYLRSRRQNIDVAGNVRALQWQWVPLPRWDGLSNRCFENEPRAHQVIHINQTPGNSFAAFGPVDSHPGWQYLFLVHRQALNDHAARSRVGAYAAENGIQATLIQGTANQQDFQAFSRQGDRVFLREFDPDSGVLQVEGRLPFRIWLLLALYLVADAAFSLAFLIASWRYAHAFRFDDWRAGRKVALGLFVAGGIPLVLALMVGEGGINAALFREIQERHLEMEQGLLGLEDRFNEFRRRMSGAWRRAVKKISWPLNPNQAVQVFEEVAPELGYSEVSLFNKEGTLLVTRNSLLWPPYRASSLDRPHRLRLFQEWVIRGYYLIPTELDLLDLGSPGAVRLSPEERLRLLLEFANRPQSEAKGKILSALAKTFLHLINTGIYEEASAGKADAAVMLEMFLKGQAHRFFNDALLLIGNLMQFSYTGFNGLGIFDAVRDPTGHAQLLVMAFYRMSDFVEFFLYQELKPPDPARGNIAFDAVSLYKGKVHFNHRVSFGQKELFKRLLTDFGTTIRCLMPDETGNPILVSAVRSEQMPDYLLIASVPFREVTDRITSLQRQRLLILTGLLSMLVPMILWLRYLLLIPLPALQETAEGIRCGRRDLKPLPQAVGEMKVLSELFQETVAGLRQMDIAKTIQENLLPGREAVFGPCRLVGQTEMMSLVGGDYYDWIPRGDNQYLIVVGDVTGHGLPAAIVVALVRSGLMILAQEKLPVNEICRIMNEELLNTLSRIKMMTCLVGNLDLNTMTFEYCNAGHAYPIVLGADGSAEYLKQTNLALGSLRRRSFRIDSRPLRSGDTLIVYSDGLVEIPNAQGKILGYDGFLREVQALSSREPDVLCDQMFALAKRHAAGVPPNDDMTVLVVQVRPEGSSTS
jgi:hypothetical protein